jgi:hypothetical protein
MSQFTWFWTFSRIRCPYRLWYFRSFQITQHLAPDEQNVIVPWIKTFPKKMVDRFPTYLWPLGTVAFVYSVITVTDATDQAQDYAHRF